MNRREFFKLPAALALVAAVPSIMLIAKTDASVLPAGSARELMAYDITMDRMIFQHDISDGMTQLDVTFLLDYTHMHTITEMQKESYLMDKRKEALSLLYKSAKEHKMDLTRLVKLPFPESCEHARYV